MPSVRDMRMRWRIEGFQCHHVIPTQIIDKPPFERFFLNLQIFGFDPDDFETNGMHLPCPEQMAVIVGKPLHRGSHPQYNKLVAEHIAVLSPMPPAQAYVHVRVLQRQLRKALHRNEIICRNDTPALSRKLRILEDEATALYGFLDQALKQ
jgi:A nuclease family of the HNH/ENDO VII superfamily with conserved AHH